MDCGDCRREHNCILRYIANEMKGADLTGCYGYGQRKPIIKESKASEFVNPQPRKFLTLADIKLGDTVIADSNEHNLRTFRLPGYIANSPLKVIGFTKEKVVCDWDGGKPFKIPPELLRFVDREEGDHE